MANARTHSHAVELEYGSNSGESQVVRSDNTIRNEHLTYLTQPLYIVTDCDTKLLSPSKTNVCLYFLGKHIIKFKKGID